MHDNTPSHPQYGPPPLRKKGTLRILLQRAVFYILGVIVVLLLGRIVLYLLGANPETPFVDFVYSLSGIFSAPFSGIFPQANTGTVAFDTNSIVAIVVYWLVAIGIAKLLNLTNIK